jgi:Cof subfamily protein (haloacid dehalogenase superfamily)
VLTARTARALAEARTAGIEVIVATGRPALGVLELCTGWGLEGLAVTGNGAQILDLRRRRAVLQSPMQDRSWREAVPIVRAALPGAAFAGEDEWTLVAEPGFSALYPAQGYADLPVIEAHLGPLFKLIVAHADVGGQLLLEAVVAAASPQLAVTGSSAQFVEVAAPGVDKGGAIGWVCRQRGYDLTQVLAFGDWLNDLAMLRVAGWSIGMANAHPEVLAIVDEVAPPNHEDGVAQVLEALLGMGVGAIGEGGD